MAAVAALAKALRGGRSGSADPAIGRLVAQEDGSSAANLAPRRHLHTDMAEKKNTPFEKMADKYSHVRGHFEPSESEFVILHLNERLNTIEGYLKSSRRLWLYPLMTLVVGGFLVSPVIFDYFRLKKIERQIQTLNGVIGEAKIKSKSIEIGLRGP